MCTTYFVVIAAICVILSLLALVAYVVRKISPSSFRLRFALARVFSFSVEMESRAGDAKDVKDQAVADATDSKTMTDPRRDGARKGRHTKGAFARLITWRR